jgi:hypothetical protein
MDDERRVREELQLRAGLPVRLLGRANEHEMRGHVRDAR